MASQQFPKAKYTLYHRMTDHLVDDYRLLMDRPGAEKATPKEVLTELFAVMPGFSDTMDTRILVEEYFWIREGSHVILPENFSTLKNLLKANRELPPGRFTLPFDSFTVAPPKDASFDGVRLPPFLVTIMPYKKTLQYATYPFYDYVGLRRPAGVSLSESSEKAQAISISLRDIDNAYIRSLLIEDNFQALLNCKNTAEFQQLSGTPWDLAMPLNDRELAVAWLCFKVVMALGSIWHSSDEQCLVSGFTINKNPQWTNHRPELNPQFSTLKA